MVEPPRRPRKPQGEVKRTAFGTRLRAELRDYLAVQAASNGRALSEEIEYRLEHCASRAMRGAGRGLWHCYEFWRRLRPSTAVGSTITRPSIWFGIALKGLEAGARARVLAANYRS